MVAVENVGEMLGERSRDDEDHAMNNLNTELESIVDSVAQTGLPFNRGAGGSRVVDDETGGQPSSFDHSQVHRGDGEYSPGRNEDSTYEEDL